MPVCHLRYALSLAICTAASPALAQEDLTGTGPAGGSAGGVSQDVVQEIRVTARSLENTLPLELAAYGSDLELLTDEQIRNHGFVDVAQALEMLVPGLNVTTQAGAFSYVDLSLHGSRTSDVLWTVDGVRINNRLYNSTSPADTLPASMIERTEVLKGGHGLMYGTQAAAGVINVVTRAFSDTPDGALSAGADSHNGQHLDGYFRSSAGDHKFVVWASRDTTDGYEIYDVYQPDATTRKRGYMVNSSGAKYGYDFSDNLRLSLSALHTEARLDYPNPQGNSVNDRAEDVVSGRLDFEASEHARFFLKGYYHNWDTDYFTEPDPSEYWGYDDVGLTAGAELAPADGALEYHVGFDYQKYEGVDEVLQIAGEAEEVRAVYGQVRTRDKLFEDTAIAAGLRYNETGGSESVVGSISALHNFSDSLYIKGVAGTSFLLPDAYNLYAIDACCAYGNPNLEAEEAASLDVSVGGRLDLMDRPVSWQVTGWERRVDNLIRSTAVTDDAPVVVPPQYDRVFINVGEEVRVRGGEIVLRGPITDTLSFSLSHSYSSEKTASGEQITGRPRLNRKFSLSYASQTRPFGLELAVKYVGKTRTDVTGFAEQEYGDYYVANIGAHLFLDRDQRHRVNLRLENALDEDYATRVGSTVLNTSSSGERFMYRRLGSPLTAFLNYSYAF